MVETYKVYVSNEDFEGIKKWEKNAIIVPAYPILECFEYGLIEEKDILEIRSPRNKVLKRRVTRVVRYPPFYEPEDLEKAEDISKLAFADSTIKVLQQFWFWDNVRKYGLNVIGLGNLGSPGGWLTRGK